MNKTREMNELLQAVAGIAANLRFERGEEDNTWYLREGLAVVGGVTLVKVKVTKVKLNDSGRAHSYTDAYKAWGLTHIPSRDTGGYWEEVPIQHTRSLPDAVAVLVAKYLAMALGNRGFADRIQLPNSGGRHEHVS